MASKQTLKMIPTSQIRRDPTQPREHFDAEKLQELADSMREIGQQQAITVRYMPKTRDYVIIMGERRWRAAKMIELAEVACMVQHDVDDEEAFIKAVAENVCRADMTPMEEGKAFKRLADAGWTCEQMAAKFGKSAEYVGYRIDLLGLTDAAAEALAQGHLPVGTAWYVCRLTKDQQSVFLRKWGRGEFASPTDANSFAQAMRNAAEREQFGLFGMEEPSMEEREAIIATRKRVTAKVDQLSRAGEILSELANMDPAELAKVLAGAPGGVAGYRARIDHLQKAGSKAMSNLRRAQSIAAVATLDTDLISV